MIILDYIVSCEIGTLSPRYNTDSNPLMSSGNANVNPHEPVIGAGEAARKRRSENANKGEQRIRIQRPEDRRVHDLQILARKYIVGSEVPGRGIGEIRCIKCWITLVSEICATLQ